MSREQILNEIRDLDLKLMDLILEHWLKFGHFGTWQFWFNVIFFMTPLIFTYFFIDRKKIFQVAFFGYSFHVMFVYLDVVFTRFNFWAHPYHMIPFIPVSIPVDGSLVPVAFMFAYQYSINRNKNYYFVTIITAIAVMFVAGFWKYLQLLEFHNGMNLIYLLFIDITLAFLSYWFTNLFLKLREKCD